MFKGQAFQEEVLGLTDLEHADTTILQNVRYYTPFNMASIQEDLTPQQDSCKNPRLFSYWNVVLMNMSEF
jgi:hypothetical protein